VSTLSPRDSSPAPNISSKADRNLGAMFHLSVSIDALPWRVAEAPRTAARPLSCSGRMPVRGREGSRAAGPAHRAPASRAACYRNTPQQPYIQRRRLDVPPQRPVQRPAHRQPGQPARLTRGERDGAAAGRTGPPPGHPGTAAGAWWPPSTARCGRRIGFRVIHGRISHIPGCSALTSS